MNTRKKLLIFSGLFLIVFTAAANFFWYGPGSVNGIFLNPRFGDMSNYATFSTTGHLRLYGNATAWDDLRVGDGAIRVGSTAPSLGTFVSGGLRAYLFDAGTINEIEFGVQFPHSWRLGSTISPHLHWTPTSSNTNQVVWGLEYSWANIGSTFGAPTTLKSTNLPGGTAWAHKLSEFGTITNTNSFSSMMMCRVFRDATNSADAYPDNVSFLEFDIHFEVDSLGSDQEYVK